uniref:Uncharacterized protein n=1 Tax=Solanum lycopersicum TaxID=4081 RepID=A0A3Q7GB95_SOLLC
MGFFKSESYASLFIHKVSNNILYAWIMWMISSSQEITIPRILGICTSSMELRCSVMPKVLPYHSLST